jgi:hypothetical protein
LVLVIGQFPLCTRLVRPGVVLLIIHIVLRVSRVYHFLQIIEWCREGSWSPPSGVREESVLVDFLSELDLDFRECLQARCLASVLSPK